MMRIVTIMGNVQYYKTVIVPNMLSFLEKKFKIRFTSDARNLYDTIDQLDLILFHNYIKRQFSKIHGTFLQFNFIIW